MTTSCELHSLFILNPDDYERGRMSPDGTQSFGALCVVYKLFRHLRVSFLCTKLNDERVVIMITYQDTSTTLKDFLQCLVDIGNKYSPP